MRSPGEEEDHVRPCRHQLLQCVMSLLMAFVAHPRLVVVHHLLRSPLHRQYLGMLRRMASDMLLLLASDSCLSRLLSSRKFQYRRKLASNLCEFQGLKFPRCTIRSLSSPIRSSRGMQPHLGTHLEQARWNLKLVRLFKSGIASALSHLLWVWGALVSFGQLNVPALARLQ